MSGISTVRENISIRVKGLQENNDLTVHRTNSENKISYDKSIQITNKTTPKKKIQPSQAIS